jgi:hypothetical protein
MAPSSVDLITANSTEKTIKASSKEMAAQALPARIKEHEVGQ